MIYLRLIRNISFSLIFFFSLYSSVYAASLYVEPSLSSVEVGATLTATLFVDSQGEYINNIEGSLAVNDAFEILGASTANSNINLWVEQPTFISKAVSFNGGITNPGYLGSRGKVVSITLRALKPGVGVISFNSGSVRLNDGLGTESLNSKTGASVVIADRAPVETVQPVLEVEKKTTEKSVDKIAGDAVVINSNSSPDSEKWYKTKDSTFSWGLPDGVIAIKTLFDDKKATDPSILYNNIFYSKTVTDLDDGVWYFHLKYQTKEGWSKTAHKKIQIDNSSPSIESLDYEILDNNLVKIIVESSDDVSAISKININVDGSSVAEVSDFSESGQAQYIFPSSYFGLQEIVVEVFDLAGNSVSRDISIDFPKVDVPEITDYSESIKPDEDIFLQGTSIYKDTEIKIFIENEDGEVYVSQSQTDSQGNFSYTADQLNISRDNTLTAWVQVLFDDENEIITSEKVYIDIKPVGLFDLALSFNQKLIIFMPTIIVLAIIVLLIHLISKKINEKNSYWYKRRKVLLIRREALGLINAFKNSVEGSVKHAKHDLESKSINEIEDDILFDLLKNFKITEKLITSKLRKSKRVSKKMDKDLDIQ
jgi:hypothetical protein